MHEPENVLVHDVDLHAELGFGRFQALDQSREIYGAPLDVHDHDHREEILKQSLRDVLNRTVVLGQHAGERRADAGTVLAESGDDDARLVSLLDLLV